MEVLLDVRGLRTQFHTKAGVVRAVDGVSWNVRKGETRGKPAKLDRRACNISAFGGALGWNIHAGREL